MPRERLFTIHKKDFDIQTFKSGGPGGQHQNKTDSGVRIIHRASGARGESRSERSQHRNKRLAFEHLVETKEFKIWLNRCVYELTSGKTIEERVEEAMDSKNIKIEIKDEKGHWQMLTSV